MEIYKYLARPPLLFFGESQATSVNIFMLFIVIVIFNLLLTGIYIFFFLQLLIVYKTIKDPFFLYEIKSFCKDMILCRSNKLKIHYVN